MGTPMMSAARVAWTLRAPAYRVHQAQEQGGVQCSALARLRPDAGFPTFDPQRAPAPTRWGP